ncbi:DMT family transporter [Alkalihalophilus lindianensis]|uniref:DMT family transporter n=1 Tax=Alkalihalophilus lindianensis TaxID=1630542 RepID=A0ABU3X4L5_9BACI|nr:DMT family transporter [Alkalihalophilus lindianensis]MDV2682827.1 DMT family transporter [Alkalihalophilus lindianensis]
MNAILSKFQRFPYVLLVLATFFWGTNFVFSRMLVEYMPPLQLSFIRWTIASLVFLPFVYKELRQHGPVLLKNWKVLTVMACTGVAGFNSLIYIAIQYTTSINASLVNSLAPLLIVILSVLFLKETFSRIQFIGIIVSLLGVLIVITQGSFERLLTLTFNRGDLIVLVGVFCWSVYSVVMKKYSGGLPKRPTFLVTMYIGMLGLFPFFLFERTYAPVQITELPFEVIGGVLYLAVFPSIVSFVCWNEGIIQVGPGKSSNFLHLIVLFTAAIAVLIGAEKVTITQFVGGLAILTGVILASNPEFLYKWIRRERPVEKSVSR